ALLQSQPLLSGARTLRCLDRAAYRDRSLPAEWRRVRYAHANARASIHRRSPESARANPTQDVGPLSMARSEKYGLAVLDGLGSNIPDSADRKKSSSKLQRSGPTHIRLLMTRLSCWAERNISDLFHAIDTGKSEILRFAQNDKMRRFSRRC